MNKLYINIHTGTIDDYDGWWYDDENGESQNAVERGEVVKITTEQLESLSKYILNNKAVLK